MGIVPNLAHLGGNITGLTFFVPELMAKRLELLKEVVPSMTRAGLSYVEMSHRQVTYSEVMAIGV
jgi:hypothetical protein